MRAARQQEQRVELLVGRPRKVKAKSHTTSTVGAGGVRVPRQMVDGQAEGAGGLRLNDGTVFGVWSLNKPPKAAAQPAVKLCGFELLRLLAAQYRGQALKI